MKCDVMQGESKVGDNWAKCKYQARWFIWVIKKHHYLPELYDNREKAYVCGLHKNTLMRRGVKYGSKCKVRKMREKEMAELAHSFETPFVNVKATDYNRAQTALICKLTDCDYVQKQAFIYGHKIGFALPKYGGLSAILHDGSFALCQVAKMLRDRGVWYGLHVTWTGVRLTGRYWQESLKSGELKTPQFNCEQ